jgi:hypothetical protein
MTTEDAAPAEPSTESESDALALRRVAARIDPAAPRIGLALSGGGIRSATFCLGIVRALARNKVLHRFDYLSTVSGGGYIGSAFGRLFHAGPEGDPAAVEAGIANDGSLFLWWLRNNGRFLAPAGAADLVQALASQVRGFLATQAETAVLIMLFACAITLPHLAYSFVYAIDDGLPLSMSLWWYWVLPLPAAGAVTMCYAYWFLGKETGGGLATAVLATIVGVYLAVQAHSTQLAFDGTLLSLGAIGMLPSPVAWICARVSGLRRSEETNRVRYTKALAWCLKAMAVIFAFGVLDMLSWTTRLWLQHLGGDIASGHVATGVGITTILIGREIAIATVPGEPLHKLQKMWKEHADVPHPLFYGYTFSSGGTWAGYIPDLRSAAYSGYGADASTRIEVGAGEKIILRHLTFLYELLGMWLEKPGRS